MATKIQLRRDLAANWTSANPILSQGEMGVETDTNKIKFGNGSDRWNSLSYFEGEGSEITYAKVVAALGYVPYNSENPNNYQTETQVNSKVSDRLVATNIKKGTGIDLSVSGNDVTISATGTGAATWGSITGTLSDQSDLNSALEGKASTGDIKDSTITIQKNGTDVDSFTLNQSTNKSINIPVPTSAADVSALPDSTKYGKTIEMTMDSSTYVLTLKLKDQDGTQLGTEQTVDLPLESVVVSGSYDKVNKKIVLTLKDGSTVDIPVGDLVSGLQSEITSTNMLSSDLVTDEGKTHKFVTSDQMTAWTNKQDAITNLSTIESNAQAGKDASDTIAEYGDIVSHNASEFATSAQGGKADTALQASNITSGDTNGTIKVKDTEVAVKGLGSAAYTASTAYATSAQGSKADTALQPNEAITAGTHSKITYDANGLVTGGADLGETDITDALGYTPYNSTNPSGYVNSTTVSGMITDSALPKTTKYGADLNYSNSKLQLKDQDGNLIGSEITIATGSANWGSIGGTLSDQTDLSQALANKMPSSTKYGADLSYSNNKLQLKDQDGTALGNEITMVNGHTISYSSADEELTFG